MPSTSWVLGFKGDTASYELVKGLIINDLTITMDAKGWLTCSGTAYTDGTMTVKTTFTFPATSAAVDFIVGTMADFLIADQGGTQVTKKALFRGFELNINNNLDLGDAHSMIASAGKYLGSLRTGTREYGLTINVEGHQGDEFWIDWLAETEKELEINVTSTADKYFKIAVNSCVISNIAQSFEGIRDVNAMQIKMFYNSTDSSPLVLEVGNLVADYLQ